MQFSLIRKTAAALFAAALCAAASAQMAIDFSSARGIGTAPDKVLVENIRVLTPGPAGSSTPVESGYSVVFKFDPQWLYLVPEQITLTDGSGATTCANAEVSVYNSVQGSTAPIAGATVTIGSRIATTNAQGVAAFSGLPAGLNSVSVYNTGYVAAAQSALMGCADTNRMAVALSPSSGQSGGLTTGQFRVILTWGANPTDLDSHMTGGVNADIWTRWHLYYADTAAGGVCKLDVDDRSGYGPETVTCPATGSTTSLPDGVYRYSVHHYSGSGTIGTSGAGVRLEFANGTVYNYTPPATGWTGANNVWTVFELNVFNGAVTVVPVNSITGGVNSGSVRAPKVLYGQPESARFFQGLTK